MFIKKFLDGLLHKSQIGDQKFVDRLGETAPRGVLDESAPMQITLSRGWQRFSFWNFPEPVVPQAAERIFRMDCFARWPEALQQISQRTLDVFFIASQAFLPLSDTSEREQNQQRFMGRTLSPSPPEFYLAEFLSKFATCHDGSDSV